MENKKQSSVEWLIQQFNGNTSRIANIMGVKKYNSIIEKSKAMHKEEYRLIYEGLLQNVGTSVKQNDLPTFEQYYNETFGGQNEN